MRRYCYPFAAKHLAEGQHVAVVSRGGLSTLPHAARNLEGQFTRIYGAQTIQLSRAPSRALQAAA
eukprot:scaffold136550_cov24-Tisochrysis_lutea.AAC.1